ncbi:hypothetical protein Q604_UNBC18548G0016 [human gut metagenome]|uniref:Uncharacterized protein n=1 Tax=human gut metagenome TaxID=408170 RepID=W1WRQ4_9ZZZZ
MCKKLLMNNNWIRINAVDGIIPMTDIQVNTGDKLEIKVFRKTQSSNKGYVYDARNVGSSYHFYDPTTNLYSVAAGKSGYVRISGHYVLGQQNSNDALNADYVIYKLTKAN